MTVSIEHLSLNTTTYICVPRSQPWSVPLYDPGRKKKITDGGWVSAVALETNRITYTLLATRFLNSMFYEWGAFPHTPSLLRGSWIWLVHWQLHKRFRLHLQGKKLSVNLNPGLWITIGWMVMQAEWGKGYIHLHESIQSHPYYLK